MTPLLSLIVSAAIVGATSAGVLTTLNSPGGPIDGAFADLKTIHEVEAKKAKAMAEFTGKPVSHYFHDKRLTLQEIDDKQAAVVGLIESASDSDLRVDNAMAYLNEVEKSGEVISAESLRRIFIAEDSEYSVRSSRSSTF